MVLYRLFETLRPADEICTGACCAAVGDARIVVARHAFEATRDAPARRLLPARQRLPRRRSGSVCECRELSPLGFIRDRAVSRAHDRPRKEESIMTTIRAALVFVA